MGMCANDGKTGNVSEASINHSSSSKPSQGTICSGDRVWMFLALTFIVISSTLLVCLIARESSKTSSDIPSLGPAMSKALVSHTEQMVISKFRAYFRTPEEQRKVEEMLTRYNNFTKAPETDTSSSFNCSFSFRCSNGPLPTPAFSGSTDTWTAQTESLISEQRLPDVVYNGCCESETIYYSPDNATLLATGEVVMVIQFRGYKQYFPYEICRHSKVKFCTGCTCMHQRTHVTAVVSYNYTIAAARVIVLEGCCKCINNGRFLP